MHHQRGTNGHDEPLPMVSRLYLVFLELAAAGIDFLSTPLGFMEYWGIYRAKRWFRGHPRSAQPIWARLGPQVRPGGCCPPWSTPRCFPGPLDVFWPKKSSKSFSTFGLCLVLISCDVKNMQKTATDTWHYVNRLVPKNDIK